MANLREKAYNYEPKTTKNVADLEFLNVDVDIEEREGTDKDGKQFTYNVIVVDGEEYRVPATVLKQLKTMLQEKPEIEYVKVKKSGEGLNTEYQVLEYSAKH